jgi:hypothetical protein
MGVIVEAIISDFTTRQALWGLLKGYKAQD